MKFKLSNLKWNRISLANVYLFSLIFTVIYLLMRKSELLLQTSLFDEASLERLQESVSAGNTLFLFVLKERIAVILALFLMAATPLCTTYVYLNVVWYGICSGLFLTVALLRYGLKGILLLMGGAFPHYLIYVPALILTLKLSKEKRIVNNKYCMQLIVILFVVITGCILESYVNPQFVAKLLKKF